MAGTALLRCAVPLLIVTVGLAAVADAQEAAPTTATAIARLFDACGLPSAGGRTFVVVNTGRAYGSGDRIRFVCGRGWRIEETPTEITLLDEHLKVTRYRKDEKLGAGLTYRKADLPPGMPPPGETIEVDFEDECRRLITRGPRIPPFLDSSSRDPVPGPLAAALRVRWAVERGRADLADQLAASACQALTERKVPDPVAELADLLAVELRCQAMIAAHDGMARPELLRRWRAIESLGGATTAGEAKALAALYEQEIAEDAAWIEPADPAESWIHRLRDLAAEQQGQPGACVVVGRGTGIPVGVTNPAEELVKLGWDSLPTVIEHMDDPRPTRSVGFGRNFLRETYSLLRYADACEQIFAAITGVSMRGRVHARAWWAKHGATAEGKEKHYASLLEGASGSTSADGNTAEFAARALLDIDEAKWLPAILERAAKATDGYKQSRLVVALGPHLDRAHERELRSFLRLPSPSAALHAARILHERLGEEAGVAEIAARLERWTDAADREDEWFGWAGPRFLADVGSDASLTALAKLVGHGDRSVKRDAIQASQRAADPRVLAALVPLLEDRRPADPDHPSRYCDYAAWSIAAMIDRPDADFFHQPEPERDGRIERLRRTLAASKDALDWPALRRAAEERRREP